MYTARSKIRNMVIQSVLQRLNGSKETLCECTLKSKISISEPLPECAAFFLKDFWFDDRHG